MGLGTGLTFGAVGNTVTDHYEFSCTFQNGSSPADRFTYLHAIHTTVGNAEGPPGLTASTPNDAFGRVIEDVVLNFVKELQDQRLVAR